MEAKAASEEAEVVKKVDRRTLRKKAPPKPRKRPVPHRTVLKKRREAAKKTWAIRRRNGTENEARATGRPPGVSDGMRKPEADLAWAAARESAKETIAKMVENKIIENDDDRSNAALEMAMTIMRGPSSHMAEKLRAARVVLEWTKAKPAAKSEVTIAKAEDWLALVTADAAKSNDGSN